MPKKFASENSKAVAARVRKEAAKEEEHQRRTKAEEDAFWADDDKHVARKQQRKEDREKRKTEQLLKKAETKALLDAEMLLKSEAQSSTPAKLTRAQIMVRNEYVHLAQTSSPE